MPPPNQPERRLGRRAEQPANLITNRPKGPVLDVGGPALHVTTGLQRERLNAGRAAVRTVQDVKFTLDHAASTNTVKAKEAEMSSWFNFSFGPTTFTTGPGRFATGPDRRVPQQRPRPGRQHRQIRSEGQNGSTGVSLEWKYSDA